MRNTFEFRDKSWINRQIISLLGKNNTALCLADWPDFLCDAPVTADFIYIRRHGADGEYASGYTTEQLRSDAKAINKFLSSAGINTDGMFMEDGSGLSPLDAVNARGIAGLLFYMKNKSRNSGEFFTSLPEAGREGTLKNYFRDPFFESRMSAKSGSMTRVRSYAGYITTLSGKKLIFCIIVNNYSGPSRNIVSGIEEILKEIIVSR